MPSIFRGLSKPNRSDKPSSTSSSSTPASRSGATNDSRPSSSAPRRPRSPVYINGDKFTASDISFESRNYRRRHEELDGAKKLSYDEFDKIDKEESKKTSHSTKTWQAEQQRRYMKERLDYLLKNEKRRKGESEAERRDRAYKMWDGSWEEPGNLRRGGSPTPKGKGFIVGNAVSGARCL